MLCNSPKKPVPNPSETTSKYGLQVESEEEEEEEEEESGRIDYDSAMMSRSHVPFPKTIVFCDS